MARFGLSGLLSSICLSVCLSVYLSVSLLIHQSISLSNYPSSFVKPIYLTKA